MAIKGNLTEVPADKASPTDLLSTAEVAELCGMTKGRVCQLLQSGEMIGKKLRGLYWMIERREADKFADQPVGGGRPRIGA